MPEAVNHPQHYGGEDNPYEHIKVSNAWGLNYELGNATKYICRAGKKTPSALEDLKKARWYIDYEIKKLEAKLGIDNPAPLAGPLDRCKNPPAFPKGFPACSCGALAAVVVNGEWKCDKCSRVSPAG